jgi:hypothetical protein
LVTCGQKVGAGLRAGDERVLALLGAFFDGHLALLGALGKSDAPVEALEEVLVPADHVRES